MSWKNILKAKKPKKLSPKQRKLDLNHDCKIDGEDFKLMKDETGHSEKEHIMISDPYENSSNQKEIKVYWMFGDGGEGETIATFTDKKLDDIYDWIEHWAKENGHSDKEIHQE